MKSKRDLDFNPHSKKHKKRRTFRIGTYGIFAVCSLAIYFLINLKIFDLVSGYRPLLQGISLAAFFTFLVLLIGKLIEKFIVKEDQSIGHSYNLLRIIRLITYLFVLLVILSTLFQNWYTAAVSFGLISLILGFALQVPISSFIGWLYIVFRTPYGVGDRIQIDGFRGDVVDISYLDTTLLEFNGAYVGNDRRTGRIVRFPNTIVLKSEVFNYSGPQAPFIWNEAPIQIAFTSNLDFVEKSLLAAAKEDFENRHNKTYKVENWEPAVYFRNNSYAWLEAVISYPVLPKETTPRRNRILKKALDKLNAHPDKVQFPEGTQR